MFSGKHTMLDPCHNIKYVFFKSRRRIAAYHRTRTNSKASSWSSTMVNSRTRTNQSKFELFEKDSETIASDISSSFIADTKFDYDQSEDASIVSKYGYNINKLLSHTINGCIYLAEIIISDNNNKLEELPTIRNNIKLPSSPTLPPISLSTSNAISNEITTKKSLIRIKKYEKNNGDNIIQEALILHYLTIKNIPPSPNICKYIDFIETDLAYYLIQEYGEYISLDDLILTGHKYITMKRMKKKTLENNNKIFILAINCDFILDA